MAADHADAAGLVAICDSPPYRTTERYVAGELGIVTHCLAVDALAPTPPTTSFPSPSDSHNEPPRVTPTGNGHRTA